MRRIALSVTVLALAGLGAWAWQTSRDEPDPDADLPTYVVEVGAVELTLRENGTVQPRQTVAVKSKVPGRVREVRVAEGDPVRAGQLVAVVEPDAAVAMALSQRRMEVRRLALELAQKDREWRRLSRLRAEGLTADQVAEVAERDWQNADSLYRQARTALNLLEREANQPETDDRLATRLDGETVTDYRILAPIDGIVSSIKVKAGELATSGTTGIGQEGALLMEIADQTQLEVHVDINEIDIARVKPGMPAAVTLASRPGVPIAARVARVAVAPKVGENRLVVYPVVLDLPERPPELRQGMSAGIDLALDSEREVLRIPVLAFIEREGKTFVRRREGEAGFADREITIGLKGDRFAAVHQGLAAKDVIAARYPVAREGS